MQYRITRVSHGETMACVTRKQFPAAKRALREAMYDGIHANALLDTRYGHKLMNAAQRLDRHASATIAIDGAQFITFECIGG